MEAANKQARTSARGFNFVDTINKVVQSYLGAVASKVRFKLANKYRKKEEQNKNIIEELTNKIKILEAKSEKYEEERRKGAESPNKSPKPAKNTVRVLSTVEPKSATPVSPKNTARETTNIIPKSTVLNPEN